MSVVKDLRPDVGVKVAPKAGKEPRNVGNNSICQLPDGFVRPMAPR